jgi:hypothetical protein
MDANLSPEKTPVTITFEVAIVFLTIGGALSR